jgi:hypothetical protein
MMFVHVLARIRHTVASGEISSHCAMILLRGSEVSVFSSKFAFYGS